MGLSAQSWFLLSLALAWPPAYAHGTIQGRGEGHMHREPVILLLQTLVYLERQLFATRTGFQ